MPSPPDLLHKLNYTIDGIAHSIETSNRIDESLYHSIGSPDLIITDKTNAVCRELKSMICWWKRVAEENSVDWWMTAGSLLGVVRHNGVIPWDDDIDISVRTNSFNTMERLVHLGRGAGSPTNIYEIKPCLIGFRIYPIGRSFPFIDIWEYGKRSTESNTVMTVPTSLSPPILENYTYAGPRNRLGVTSPPSFYASDQYPRYFHTPEELDPVNIEYGSFEGIAVPIPPNSHAIIARWYGNTAIHSLYYDNHVDAHSQFDVRTAESFAQFLGGTFTLIGMNPSCNFNKITGDPKTAGRINDRIVSHGYDLTDIDLMKLIGSSTEATLCQTRPDNIVDAAKKIQQLIDLADRYIGSNRIMIDELIREQLDRLNRIR
jgi:hypothetical protein